ncbi:hypothetical protein QQP08_012284 [Theobroma cacao]|nr:hypothetical protein QQP08_012284 [Theobroma cacao]
MTSRTGSLTILRGEPKEEGPDRCLPIRGEPEVLRGESGGVLAAGNMEGNKLVVEPVKFPVAFNDDVPVLASATSFREGKPEGKQFFCEKGIGFES